MTPRSIFTLCLLLLSLGLSAQKIPVPAPPNPPRLVNDFVSILSTSESNQLEQKLDAYSDSTSTQIAIAIVTTVAPYSMVDYAVALGRAWGVGGKEFNNGIVILVAYDDHQMFIATGYGMEGSVPDIVASHIIEEDLTPNFRRGLYYEGLDEATTSLIQAAAGEYQAQEKEEEGKGTFFFILFILILLFFILSSGHRGNRRNGGDRYNRKGRGYGLGPFLEGIFLGNMLGGGTHGGNSYKGGGFGGGGFGGFGGGSFGGGGAGGSW